MAGIGELHGIVTINGPLEEHERRQGPNGIVPQVIHLLVQGQYTLLVRFAASQQVTHEFVDFIPKSFHTQPMRPARVGLRVARHPEQTGDGAADPALDVLLGQTVVVALAEEMAEDVRDTAEAVAKDAKDAAEDLGEATKVAYGDAAAAAQDAYGEASDAVSSTVDDASTAAKNMADEAETAAISPWIWNSGITFRQRSAGVSASASAM